MKISPNVVHTMVGNIWSGGKPENAFEGCGRPFSKMATMIFTYIKKLVENAIQSPLLKCFITQEYSLNYTYQKSYSYNPIWPLLFIMATVINHKCQEIDGKSESITYTKIDYHSGV